MFKSTQWSKRLTSMYQFFAPLDSPHVHAAAHDVIVVYSSEILVF